MKKDNLINKKKSLVCYMTIAYIKLSINILENSFREILHECKNEEFLNSAEGLINKLYEMKEEAEKDVIETDLLINIFRTINTLFFDILRSEYIKELNCYNNLKNNLAIASIKINDEEIEKWVIYSKDNNIKVNEDIKKTLLNIMDSDEQFKNKYQDLV